MPDRSLLLRGQQALGCPMTQRKKASHPSLRGRALAIIAVLALRLLFTQGCLAGDADILFDIPASPVHRGLNMFAEQANIQILYAYDQVEGLQVNSLQGLYSLEDGLQKLLAGTCLQTGTISRSRSTLNIINNEKRFWFMKRNRSKCSKPGAIATLSAAILASFTAAGSSAQEDSAPTARMLEEIVVTARKREESMQRAPVAVSALTRQSLDNAIVTDMTKIGEIAPQVSMSQGGSGTGAVITVRGVSSASNDSGLDQSVAIEIDGVPISRGQVVTAALFDLDQVQVLQGPQALFFGKNSPAGVVSLRSADPTDTFEGYVSAGYEFEAHQRILEGAISGPVTETLKARLALRGSEMDGWIRNQAQPVQDFVNPSIINPGATMGSKGPDDEIRSARLSLLWEPLDDFDANLKLLWNKQERNAGNASSEPFCVGDTSTPVLLGSMPIPGADCKRNRKKVHGSVAPEYTVNIPKANGGKPYFDSEFHFAALNLNKHLDSLTLTSTTGFYDQSVTQMSVSDWSPFASIWAASDEDYRLWTQELRLNTTLDGPLNFMAGLYYESFDRDYTNAADLFHNYNPAKDNYATAIVSADTTGKYYSAFGQVTWEITPELELAVGARYSKDEKTTKLLNHSNSPAYPTLLPEGQVLRSRFSDSNVSPEATLSWFPADDHLLYAAWKTGYKAGGISNPFLLYNNATPDNVQFEPEKARGFEIGYKSELLDNRLRLDLVAYRYKYDDLQVVSYNSETISFTIGNAASARIEGIQGSFEWLALDDLTLHGNLGYNRARYLSYPNAQCYPGQTAATGCVNGVQNLKGEDLLRAPRLTYSLGAEYSPALIPGWMTALSLQASHTSSFETATDNAPAGHQDSYWLLNAALRVGPENGRYELALIGRNLTDEYYMLNSNGWSGASNPDQQVGFFNRPREILLQATVRF